MPFNVILAKTKYLKFDKTIVRVLKTEKLNQTNFNLHRRINIIMNRKPECLEGYKIGRENNIIDILSDFKSNDISSLIVLFH